MNPTDIGEIKQSPQWRRARLFYITLRKLPTYIFFSAAAVFLAAAFAPWIYTYIPKELARKMVILAITVGIIRILFRDMYYVVPQIFIPASDFFKITKRGLVSDDPKYTDSPGVITFDEIEQASLVSNFIDSIFGLGTIKLRVKIDNQNHAIKIKGYSLQDAETIEQYLLKKISKAV